MLHHRIPNSYKVVIALLLTIILYGCDTEKSVFQYMEKHPEMMEKVDTFYQKNRVVVKSEQRQIKATRNLIAYNPYQPGDSLVLQGNRFRTTIRNVGDKTVIQTKFNGIDTTFITTKTVYKFPNVWIEKYNTLVEKQQKRTYFFVGVTGGLCFIVVLLLFLLYLLARRSLPGIGPVGWLSALRSL